MIAIFISTSCLFVIMLGVSLFFEHKQKKLEIKFKNIEKIKSHINEFGTDEQKNTIREYEQREIDLQLKILISEQLEGMINIPKIKKALKDSGADITKIKEILCYNNDINDAFIELQKDQSILLSKKEK